MHPGLVHPRPRHGVREEEYRAITDPKGRTPERHRYLRFRDLFRQEVQQTERLSQAGEPTDHERAKHIEAHILAEYIRMTHTDADATSSRINGWLDHEGPGCREQPVPLHLRGDRLPAMAGADRRQPRPRSRLAAESIDPPARRAGQLHHERRPGRVGQPGIPRAAAPTGRPHGLRCHPHPPILLRNVGINNAVSFKEWNKHLAITGWDLETPPPSEPRLTYSACQCRHPVYEKSIRDFASWIDAEIRSVREELDLQCRLLGDRGKRFSIHLPREVTLDIRPAGSPQTPIYTYRDIQFRLDQDEIQQLFMGESLYGDPSLCIRELLQNALDALEVRDLRLKMLDKGGEPYEPVDRLRFVDGEPEELRVTLTWGNDEASGQDYLLVADNGVGMTEEVITRYFARSARATTAAPSTTKSGPPWPTAG